MRRSIVLFLLALMLCASTGCAAIGVGASTRGRASSNARSESAGSLRDQLNEGYSVLYTQLDGLSKVNEILYVKVESDDVQRVVDDFAGYSGRLGKRLTTLSKQFPALDIHRDHTPAILKAAYEAQKKGLLKMFAPVVGASGKVFERGLLIRLLVAADEERYLTEELGEREPDPVLSEIMQHASQRFVGLSNEINALLKKRFYK